MSIANNNTTIVPTTGYDASFSWQVGLNSNAISPSNLNFRATIRPLNGNENYTRIPSPTVLYEETGISLNSSNNQGQWLFPLSTNASISGGPYRNYQVVIEAYDQNGNTSAGNLVGSYNELGWTAFGNGYDIVAIQNPRQTGIELGSSLPTYQAFTGVNSGILSNNTGLYSSLNYMGSNGEINIRYLQGNFNSNLAGGFLYVWTGQFPKLEAALGINGYSDVNRVQFSFNPNSSYIYHSSAATKYRGANNVYISVSFFDNLDALALQNGINIWTGLYISDNAIAYNDAAVGSLSIGGFQTIYSMQYTGNQHPTGILGTGTPILSTQYNNGVTSVLYMSNPLVATGLPPYTGTFSTLPGGAGQNAIIYNNTSLSSPTLLYINCNVSNTWICPVGMITPVSCSSCCSELTSLSIGDSILSNPYGASSCFNITQNGNYSYAGMTFNVVQDDPSNWQGSAGDKCGTPYIITRTS